SFEQSWPIFILQSRHLVRGTEKRRREIQKLRAGYKKHLIYVFMFRGLNGESRRVAQIQFEGQNFLSLLV
ncbi:MAG: hypothetical protein OIF58_04385, partial [Cohaesibacter sp.]|nr:hypothetical protein [Cohaesibacter sp.]